MRAIRPVSIALSGTAALGRLFADRDGRPERDRVDRGDVEPGHGLPQGVSRLRALLRGNVRRALARNQDHPYEQGFDLRLWPERLERLCAGVSRAWSS